MTFGGLGQQPPHHHPVGGSAAGLPALLPAAVGARRFPLSPPCCRGSVFRVTHTYTGIGTALLPDPVPPSGPAPAPGVGLQRRPPPAPRDGSRQEKRPPLLPGQPDKPAAPSPGLCPTKHQSLKGVKTNRGGSLQAPSLRPSLPLPGRSRDFPTSPEPRVPPCNKAPA